MPIIGHEALPTRRCAELVPNAVVIIGGNPMSSTTLSGASQKIQEVSAIERETMSRVMWRLMPILMVGYFCAYLDRVNTGFAGLTMTKALGFSSTVFGLGGGIFFIGYLLFEIPSNLLMNRVGARRWIARILVTWALVSAMTAFVTGSSSFYGVRFVLGLAEAGFFPGVILYMTWWFPSHYRARMVSWFMMAIPISNILGSLVSSPILSMNGFLGLQGWQWLFLIEAVPPIILGIVVMFYLTDRPSEAKWLTPAQRQWLTQRIESEQKQREAVRHYGLGEALRSPRVWGLTVGYFGQSMAGYGLVMFLPQIVHKFGVRVSEVGLITAIPYVFATVFMVWWSMRSDRTGDRVKHFVIASVMTSMGLVLCLVSDNPLFMLAALIFAQMGLSSIAPTFWPLPTAMLTGTAAAGGIALINAVGNLGGFFGPYFMGFVQDATGSFQLGLLALAMSTLVSAGVVVALGHNRQLERIRSSVEQDA
jgi:MFS transporter, ACS family, tartrate transporter